MRSILIGIFTITVAFSATAQDGEQWANVLAKFKNGKAYSGIRKCDHMLGLKIPQKEFLVLRAEGNNKIGEFDKAKADATEAYGILTGDHKKMAAVQLGAALLALGAPDQAKAYFESSLGTADDAKAHYQLGLLAKADKAYPQAIEHFNKALALHPEDALTLSERGGAYAESGDMAKAKTDLDKALELEPRKAVLWNARGFFLHNKAGDHAAAISDYDRAIKLDPNYSYAFNNRGWSYYKLGDRDKALKNISRAAKKSKTNSFVYRNMGIIALESGDTEKACGHFRRALALQFTAYHGNEVEELFKANCGGEVPPMVNTPTTIDTPTVPARTNAPSRNNAP